LSLKDTTILDKTLETLFKKTWIFINLIVELRTNKKQFSEGRLKKLQKIAEEIADICEELR